MANWPLLYSQGRCKNIGVPWSPEEAHARYILQIPADYIRRGCLTLEDYEKAQGKEKKDVERTKKVQLTHLRRDQLAALCEKHDIHVTDEAPRSALLECLLNAGLPKSIPVEEVPVAQEE